MTSGALFQHSGHFALGRIVTLFSELWELMLHRLPVRRETICGLDATILGWGQSLSFIEAWQRFVDPSMGEQNDKSQRVAPNSPQ
jgi:hypothetical protein